MAGQVGIKTNLTINSANLKAQITKLQKTLAEENTFKIGINQASLDSLKELKTLVSDITKMAGRGIDVKVNYKATGSPQDALKGASGAESLHTRSEEEIRVLTRNKNAVSEHLKYVDNVWKQHVRNYSNTFEEKVKITKNMETGVITEDIETSFEKQRKAVESLKLEAQKAQTAMDAIRKIDGKSVASPQGFDEFVKEVNSLDANNTNQSADAIGRLKEQLAGFVSTMGGMKSQQNAITDSLNFEQKANKSSESIKKLRDSYNEFIGLGGKDEGGEMLAQLTDLENRMNSISKTGQEGAGTNTFKQMAVDSTALTIELNRLQSEIDETAAKQKIIDKLSVSIMNLLKLENQGLVPKGTVARFKEDLSKIDTGNPLKVVRSQADGLTQDLNMTSKAAMAAKAGLNDLGKESHGLKKISDGLKSIGIYFSAWRLTAEVFQELKRGINVVAELDNQIVQVGIDMNISAKEARKLTTESQRIAAETGIAIDEIVRVAGVYSNETENMQSVLAKVKPSAILAGVAGASATEITDMFQGVVAQYKLAQEDIEATSYAISDSIIGVAKNMSQNFDTSVKEISEVMLDAGSVMADLGYTYEETMAMAGAVMEVTRQTGSELGGVFRMIGARIGGAKNSGEDIDVEEISNAQKAYKSIGIEIVDANGKFKDQKKTLAELNEKWSGLTDVERSYIAEMSAGNRHRNTFMVLMETMQKQTELTTIAMNSQGDTLKANEKYMESSEAKMMGFKNALDTLWQNTISSDMLKNILEIGTGFVKLVDGVGVATVAIALFNTYLVISGKNGKILDKLIISFYKIEYGARTAGMSMAAFTAKTIASRVAMVALQTALTIGLAAALGLIVGLLGKVGKAMFGAKERSEEFKETIRETSDVVSEAKALNKTMESLNTKIDTASDEEAVRLKGELLDVQKRLAAIMPETATGFTAEGESISENTGKVEANIAVKEELIRSTAELWLLNEGVTKANIEASNKEAKEKIDRLKELKTMREDLEADSDSMTDVDSAGKMLQVKDIVEEYNKVLAEVVEYNASIAEKNEMIAASGREDLETLKYKEITIEGIVEKVIMAKDAQDEFGNSTENALRTVEELDKVISDSTKSMDSLKSIVDEIDDKDFDGISGKSMQTIINEYPQLLQYVNDEKKLKQELIALYDVEAQASRDALSVKLASMKSEELKSYETMNTKVANDKEWYKTNVLNNKELLRVYTELYKVDLKNYASLQEAKDASDRGYITNAMKNYNGFFAGIVQGYTQVAAAADAAAIAHNKSRKYTGMEIETDYDAGTGLYKSKMLKEYRKIAPPVSALNALNAISWSGVNPSLGSGTGSGTGSSKDKDKKDETVYESDKSFFNKHTALIEEYERQLSNLATKINKTQESIAYYKSVGSDSALQSALTLENRLYKEQEERLTLLNKAKGDLTANQNSIAGANKKLGIDMSGQTPEDLNYWLDKLYPQVKSTNQAVIDGQNKKREEFSISWNAYMDYASKLNEVETEIIGMQSTLLDILKAKYETQFQIMDRKLEGYIKNMDDTTKKMDLMDDSATFNDREAITDQSIKNTQAYKKELESALRTLEIKQNSLSKESAEWQIINEKVKEYRESIHDANKQILETQKSLKALRKEELDNSMSLMDKIAETVRKQYEEAKKAELAALKATLDAEVKAKQAEIKILQDKLDAMNDTREDKEAEVRALREEAKMWEKDNSVFAKRQLAELNALIKEKEKELEKDRIQGEIDNLEEQVGVIEEANSEKVDIVEETYDKLLNDQNVYQQAQIAMASKSQEDLLQMLLQYDDKYKGMGSVLGKAFAEGMAEEIKKSLDSFTALSDGLTGGKDIPWASSLPSGFSYEQSRGVTANAIGLQSRSMSDIGGTSNNARLDLQALASVLSNKSLGSSFAGGNVDMVVNFYTNGQMDIDKSIKSLGSMIKDSTAGSGVMLKINK